MPLTVIDVVDVVLVSVSLIIPIVIGVAISRILARIAKVASDRNNLNARDTGLYSLRLPILLLSWVVAIYVASLILRAWEVDALKHVNWLRIEDWLIALAIAIGFFGIYRFVVNTLRSIAIVKGKDPGELILINKVFGAIAFGLALVSILGQLGVNIGPVLASLGIAGLAVALALQDTLGNYFAGITIALDKPFKPGDFIRMESGQEGFVDQIGWRSTRIKPFAETYITVPNSKLTTSIVTNTTAPDLAVRVYVDCGVSYSSNLDEVEQVCKEVGKEVLNNVPGADTDFEPIVRFKEFGESNINFTVILRTRTFESSFVLKHEYIKAIHKAFNKKGIVINYPVRHLVGLTSEEPLKKSTEPTSDII